ncbi:hypothetical protein PAAG_06611 [Paracoccidioides lutzii Pb01]|uniref:Uncharacterized protein n=1 Tax=Paracoccidioides lutzii (strain ATCC MYA-826 / Pb01) TaxID=502779 RepID=C1H770_PARBA|nr:hypothetical protein PAAG_06611 [Paracoccidioides lutzii Pb01]EEH35564.2 hypothetical protein PAAG_06611 [Paracoccidioides lutzii Pb01]
MHNTITKLLTGYRLAVVEEAPAFTGANSCNMRSHFTRYSKRKIRTILPIVKLCKRLNFSDYTKQPSNTMSPDTVNVSAPTPPNTGPIFYRNSGGQCIVM